MHGASRHSGTRRTTPWNSRGCTTRSRSSPGRTKGEAVWRAAERGEREKVLEQIESFDEARVTSRRQGGYYTRAMVFDRFSEPDVMRLRDVQVSEPQAGEVLIRVDYSGVNPADSKTRAGLSTRDRNILIS
jgi:hypothetical protein